MPLSHHGACVVPEVSAPQGISCSGQGVSCSGQGVSCSGQGVSCSGQGVSCSGQRDLDQRRIGKAAMYVLQQEHSSSSILAGPCAGDLDKEVRAVARGSRTTHQPEQSKW